jgi:hypothetical protein
MSRILLDVVLPILIVVKLHNKAVRDAILPQSISILASITSSASHQQ